MSTTSTTSSDCQVLVVGAGPTGLVLAAQLLARGIRTRVIDKGDGPVPQSRALSVHARTLEVLDVMGLVDADFVVGCDGAHSRVRHDLGLPFHGQPYPQDFLLADVALEGDVRED